MTDGQVLSVLEEMSPNLGSLSMSIVSRSLNSWYAVYDISDVPGGPAGPGTPGVPSFPSLPSLPGSPGMLWQIFLVAADRCNKRRLTATVKMGRFIASHLLIRCCSLHIYGLGLGEQSETLDMQGKVAIHEH